MKPRHFLSALLLVVVLYLFAVAPAAMIFAKFCPNPQESYWEVLNIAYRPLNYLIGESPTTFGKWHLWYTVKWELVLIGD